MIEIKLPFAHTHPGGHARANEWHMVRDADYRAMLEQGWPVEVRQPKTRTVTREIRERTSRLPVVTKATKPTDS